MFIKAHTGDGRWALFNVPNGRTIEFTNVRVSVDCDKDGNFVWDFFSDERLPDAESGRLIALPDQHVTKDRMTGREKKNHEGLRFFRWVQWDTGNGPFLLVTDGPLFILNDEGRTVEALR